MNVFKKPKHKEAMFGSKSLLKPANDKDSAQKSQYNSNINTSSQYNQTDAHKFETLTSLSTSSSSSTNDSVMLNSNCSSDEGFSEYCKNISSYDDSNYYQYNNYIYQQSQNHQYANIPYLMEHSPPPSLNFSSFNKTTTQQDTQQFMQLNNISMQPADVASSNLSPTSNPYILNLNEFKSNTSNQIYKGNLNQQQDYDLNNNNNKSIINTPAYLRANEFNQIDSSGIAANDAINLQYSRYNNSNLDTMTSNYQNCSINSNFNSNSSTPYPYYYNSHHYYNANNTNPSIGTKANNSTSSTASNPNFNHFNQTNTSTNNY